MTTLQIIEIANTNNVARKAAKTAKLQKNKKTTTHGTIFQQLREGVAKDNPKFLSVLEKTEKELKTAKVEAAIEIRIKRVEALLVRCQDPKKFEMAFKQAREEASSIFGVKNPEQIKRLNSLKDQLGL